MAYYFHVFIFLQTWLMISSEAATETIFFECLFFFSRSQRLIFEETLLLIEHITGRKPSFFIEQISRNIRNTIRRQRHFNIHYKTSTTLLSNFWYSLTQNSLIILKIVTNWIDSESYKDNKTI